jgi:hypothetical protein
MDEGFQTYNFWTVEETICPIRANKLSDDKALRGRQLTFWTVVNELVLVGELWTGTQVDFVTGHTTNAFRI